MNRLDTVQSRLGFLPPSTHNYCTMTQQVLYIINLSNWIHTYGLRLLLPVDKNSSVEEFLELLVGKFGSDDL